MLQAGRVRQERRFGQTGTLFCDEENLYCGTESEIVRISENGTEEVILTVQPLVNEGAFAIMNMMDCFAAHDGWIYYVLTMATGLGLWRVGTDGSGNSRICQICPPENTILAPIRFGNGNEIYIQYGSKDGESWSLICVSAEQDTENT